MLTLNKWGFNKDYLNINFGFCSDGASVMLGRKSGVSTRIIQYFPNIIIWHCLNHRLQLVLDHAIGNINQINNFKIFLDKLYKHQNELHAISKELQIEVSKIGRVLGQRWAACSFRSAKAVWQVYPVRYEHFTYNKNSGMVNRLQNKSFLKDLALMLDVLQEISILSEALQSRAQNIVTAEKLLKTTQGMPSIL
jgi:hypothetical protein